MSKLNNSWNYNLEEAPLDTPIELLSSNDCFLLPQMKYIGTIISNGRGDRVRGNCIEGDPDYFYRSDLIAWRSI